MPDQPDQTDEEFWAEMDPDGERFAKRSSFWGCLVAVALLMAMIYGAYRLAIQSGVAFSVSLF